MSLLVKLELSLVKLGMVKEVHCVLGQISRVVKDEQGQVSAELLFVLVAVISIAILIVTQLNNTGKKTNSLVSSKSKKLLAKLK